MQPQKKKKSMTARFVDVLWIIKSNLKRNRAKVSGVRRGWMDRRRQCDLNPAALTGSGILPSRLLTERIDPRARLRQIDISLNIVHAEHWLFNEIPVGGFPPHSSI